MPEYTTSINTINFTFTSFSGFATYSYSMGIQPGGTEVAEHYVSPLRALALALALAGPLDMQPLRAALATRAAWPGWRIRACGADCWDGGSPM